MKAMLAIKEIMRIRGVKPTVLAYQLGIKQNVLSQRFTQENVSVSKLNEMARLLDYKIVLVPRSTRLPDGGYDLE